MKKLENSGVKNNFMCDADEKSAYVKEELRTRREFCKEAVATTIACSIARISSADEDSHRKRAGRNRTVTISKEEIEGLDKRIVSAIELKSNYTDNSVINGDLFDCIDFIPNEYYDLIIIDPPYNLDKNFHGNKFQGMDDSAYEEYLRSWFYKVCDKLKPNGTLYMCGDWKCTSSMQRVISEKLTVLNRITWQREKGRGAKSNWKNGMEDIWFAVGCNEIFMQHQ